MSRHDVRHDADIRMALTSALVAAISTASFMPDVPPTCRTHPALCSLVNMVFITKGGAVPTPGRGAMWSATTPCMTRKKSHIPYVLSTIAYCYTARRGPASITGQCSATPDRAAWGGSSRIGSATAQALWHSHDRPAPGVERQAGAGPASRRSRVEPPVRTRPPVASAVSRVIHADCASSASPGRQAGI